MPNSSGGRVPSKKTFLVSSRRTCRLFSPGTKRPSSGGGDASPFPAEYRVSVDVMQFEGSIGESVTLAARWSVRREEDRKLLSARQSNVREPVEGEDYDALVGAMSRALGTLSREITAAIPVQ